MIDAPPVARASYRFRAATVEVETNDARVGRWLAGIIVPWFSPATSVGNGVRVRMSSSPELFASLLARQTSATPTIVPCFNLDSGLVSLPGWIDEPGSTVAFDATFACFYRMRGHEIEVVARPGERKARIGLLRVVREALASVAASEPLLDLHAAAFEHRGRAVLVLGEKNAGKTTVLTHALASGAGLLANDRVMVSAEARAHGVPTVVSVRSYTLRTFPNITAGLPGEAVAFAAEEMSGPMRDEPPSQRARLSPAQFAGRFGARLVPDAPIGAIVFPHVAPDVRGCVVQPVAPRDGVRSLRESLYARRSGPREPTWAERISDKPVSRESQAAWAERLAGEIPLVRLLLGPDAYREPAQSWLSTLPLAAMEAP